MKTFGASFAVMLAAGVATVHCSSDTGTGTGLDGSGGSSTAGKGGVPTAGNTTGSGGGTGVAGSKGIGVGGSNNVPIAGNTGTTGGAQGSGGECAGQTASGMKGQSASILLLVDLSLSMDETPRGDNQSKLASTKEALQAAVDNLPDGLGVGLIFYPEIPAPQGSIVDLNPCFAERVAVPIAPLDAAQRALLTGEISGADSDGSTPTHDAYVFALDTLQASTLEGQKYVVLITDGAPTYGLGCIGPGMPPGVDTAPLVDESEAALTNRMIKTFVIGTPGSDAAREALSAMARVGGTGPTGCSDTGPEYCHFDMTQSTDVSAGLENVLGQISAQIPIDCNFEIPPPPNNQDSIDTSTTNVIYNGMQVPYDQTCAAATAWRFDDPTNPTEVVFCGTLCDQVKMDTVAEVGIKFGCMRVDVPR